MYLVLSLTYLTCSYIPFVIFSLLFIIAVFRIPELREHLVFAACLIFLTAFCSCGIVTSLSADVKTGHISEQAVVTAVEDRLSGDCRLYVRRQNGACSVIYGDRSISFAPGSIINVDGRSVLPDTPTNPGEFDQRDNLRRKGITSIIIADAIICDSSEYNNFFFALKKRIFRIVASGMGIDEQMVFAAVCLGDTSLLSNDMRNRFALAGCSHLIAVSGTHFAGFMVFFTFASDRFISKKSKSALAVKLILAGLYIFFGLMTGFGDSVTRACFMCICLIFVRDRLSGMCVSAVIMMMADPFSVMSMGFGMSMGATAGILLFAPVLKKKIPEFAAVALSAHIGLLPFYSMASVRLSAVNLICQAVGGLIVSLICVFFVPTLILCLIFGCEMSIVLEILFEGLEFMVGYCSELSFLSVNCGTVNSLLFIGVFAFLIVLFMPDSQLRRVILLPSFLAGSICFGIILYSYLFEPALTVVFIDVGQGDCCLIRSPSYTVLIDGGEYAKGSVVSDVLDWYGVNKIDVAFVSHWDSDHCGGIKYLYDEGRIRSVIAPCLSDPEDTELTINSVSTVQEGNEIVFEDGLSIYVLSPDGSVEDENEDSLVLEVRYNDMNMLFTGDIGTDTEIRLVREGVLSRCDILKVAHHGSESSTGNEFLWEVKPSVAVISCGRHNNYGHPAQSTLERLMEEGIEVRRTDIEGAIEFVFEK